MHGPDENTPTELAGKEKRAFPRLERKLSVSFTYEGRECIAQTVDVSKTGALFRAALIPDLDTRLLLNLTDRNNPQLSLHLKADVVRFQDGEGNQTQFAVKFGDAIARDPRRLRKFLEGVLGIAAGLIRVVDEEGGGKAYAFSFEPIHKEGKERLKALQSSLFTNYDEMEEADSILANFGKSVPGADVERHLDAKAEKKKEKKKKKGGWFGRKKSEPAPQPVEEESVEAKAVPAQKETPPIQVDAPPPVQPAPAEPTGDDINIGVMEDTPDASSPEHAAMIEQMQQMVDSGFSDTMPLPDEMAAEMQAGKPLSLDQLLAVSPTALDEGADQVELPLTAESLGSMAPDLAPADPPVPVDDEYVPAPEAPLPPDVGIKKGGGGVLSKLSSLFAGGKAGAKGEKLINPQPLPNLVARDTALSIVYRLGSSRFQGKAVRLYCAGLKMETTDLLPSLYQSVNLLIPLTGAKRISQIELFGDVTRVRPNVADSDSDGIFEVRFSMRSDKMHLELYRALLEKLTDGNP